MGMNRTRIVIDSDHPNLPENEGAVKKLSVIMKIQGEFGYEKEDKMIWSKIGRRAHIGLFIFRFETHQWNN